MNELNDSPYVATASDGPGRFLELITTGRAVTRTAISEVTGLSRSTVSQRLDALFDLGLLVETDELPTSRGRPSRMLRLNGQAAVLAAVDFGEERTRIAITDLEANILEECVEQLKLSEGPQVLLDRVSESIRRTLSAESTAASRLAGIAVGLPAPVDYDQAKIQGWSVMAGWEGYDIRGHLNGTWDVPVVIDNDVNLLTIAEHRQFWPRERHLLYIKMGTGIGSGMIVGGMVHRGAQGAAGDIGHAHINGFGDPQCRCGNLGCLEALAGGWALARDLRLQHLSDAHDARDVARLVRDGDSSAVARLRFAGRVLGEAVAYATSLLNPNVIVVGGVLSHLGDHILAGAREVIYQRSLPLATRHLQIVPSGFRSRAGIVGAAHLARDYVLSPAAVDQAVSAGSSPFRFRD